MTDKIPCQKCNELILPTTAKKTGGVCMACKQGIRESIEQSKEFYKKQKEYDPYRKLWKFLVERDTKYGFNSFSEAEKIYFSVNILDGEVYNGGMEQFFSNSSGELYSEVLESLKIVKAKNSLSLLKKATKILFGEVQPPKDREKRWNAMKQYPEDDSIKSKWEAELDEIDKLYWEDSDNLSELVRNYAEVTGLIQPFKKAD